MKNKDIISKYNDILESILIKYIFTEDINDILWQAINKYEEVEKLSKKNQEKKTKSIDNIFEKEIDLYTKNEELKSALIDFYDMRNNIKKPFKTVNALTRLFNKLDKYSNNDDSIKIEMLEKSIINNWQDVWEPKHDDKSIRITNKSSKKHGCTYVNTPTMTGEELENAILENNDLDMF